MRGWATVAGMRSGAWLALLGSALGLAAGACSGGYPLPPTRCDDYCDATQGMQCAEAYDPANCVSQCERANIDAPACHAELDAVIQCFKDTPHALQQLCVYYGGLSYEGQPNDCGVESGNLSGCVGSQFLGGFGG